MAVVNKMYSNTNKSQLHICVDNTHEICDGSCSCDGMECNISSAFTTIPARDYQIELIEDSMLIFNGHRFVGTIPMWDNSPLDSLLVKDNE